jgi:hypothetical protein
MPGRARGSRRRAPTSLINVRSVAGLGGRRTTTRAMSQTARRPMIGSVAQATLALSPCSRRRVVRPARAVRGWARAACTCRLRAPRSPREPRNSVRAQSLGAARAKRRLALGARPALTSAGQQQPATAASRLGPRETTPPRVVPAHGACAGGACPARDRAGGSAVSGSRQDGAGVAASGGGRVSCQGRQGGAGAVAAAKGSTREAGARRRPGGPAPPGPASRSALHTSDRPAPPRPPARWG